MGGGGYAFDRDAPMYDGVIVDLVVIDDGGLAVNAPDPVRRQAATVEVMPAEITEGHESKGVYAKAKVEACSHADTIEAPAQVQIEFSVWR
jgi:hypothetical protein